MKECRVRDDCCSAAAAAGRRTGEWDRHSILSVGYLAGWLVDWSLAFESCVGFFEEIPMQDRVCTVCGNRNRWPKWDRPLH